MYCTHCGTGYATGATACPQCGKSIPTFPPPTAIPNHLAAAAVTTLCCCFPFGIVALIFAAQVNSKLAMGDIPGAQVASNRAKTWTIVALVAGLLTFGGGALLTLID
jgi:Interferon-induced transmembrane protein